MANVPLEYIVMSRNRSVLGAFPTVHSTHGSTHLLYVHEHTLIDQNQEEGGGVFWAMHTVVGTPRFMTHTESAGCLCWTCREASTKMKKKRDNRRVITQTQREQRRVKRDDVQMEGSGGEGRDERRPEDDVNAVCYSRHVYHAGFSIIPH